MAPSDDPVLDESLSRLAEQLRAHIDARFARDPEEARRWLHRKLTRLVQAATEDEGKTTSVAREGDEEQGA